MSQDGLHRESNLNCAFPSSSWGKWALVIQFQPTEMLFIIFTSELLLERFVPLYFNNVLTPMAKKNRQEALHYITRN